MNRRAFIERSSGAAADALGASCLGTGFGRSSAASLRLLGSTGTICSFLGLDQLARVPDAITIGFLAPDELDQAISHIEAAKAG